MRTAPLTAFVVVLLGAMLLSVVPPSSVSTDSAVSFQWNEVPAPETFDTPTIPSQQPASFSEVLTNRTRNSKLFQNDSDPDSFRLDATLTTIHYESSLDSGVFDAEVDLSPRRVNNAQLDGWVITVNGWHHALGIPGDKTSDGWVGFGGRGGQHFFEFRLHRVGYVHWPTRALDDIGGAPSYNRANLQGSTQNISIGGVDLNVTSIATWSNLWTTPGGGALNVSWLASGDGLKEEITINKAGRDWIKNNRPPATPLDETYLTFVFRLDWNDIPKIVRNGIVQDRDSDFDDNNGTASIELLDAIDRLLAFMPVGDILVRNESGPQAGEIIDSLPLRRRFYQDAGNHFLILGARTDLMQGLADGDLVYDPTVNVQVGAGADDTDTEGGSWSNSRTRPDCPGIDGDRRDCSFRWTGVTVPQGATITAATFEPHTFPSGNDGPGVFSNIYAEDADAPSAPSSLGDFNGRVRTTNFTAWDGQSFADAFTISPDISPTIQEIVDRPGFGSVVQIFWDDDLSTGPDHHYEVKTYNNAPADGAKLHITFTAAPGPEILLTNPTLDPTSGTTATAFNFTIDYNNTLGMAADLVKVNVSDATNGTFNNFTMAIIGAGPNATFFFNGTLSIGFYTHFFWGNASGAPDNRTVDIPGPTVTGIPPTVLTVEASPVHGLSARLHGNLTDLGSASSVNVSFQWGDTMALGNATIPEESLTATGTFSFDLTGLTTSTQYFFRAKADGDSIVFGAILNFTTEAAFVPPTVTTVEASSITQTFAILIGSTSDFGELNITTLNVSFEWGFSPTALIFETPVQVVLAPASFQATLTDLEPGVRVFFRAKAEFNPFVFGAILSFTTTTALTGLPAEAQFLVFIGVAIWLVLVGFSLYGRWPWLLAATGILGVILFMFLATLLGSLAWFAFVLVFINVPFIYMGFFDPNLGKTTVSRSRRPL